MSGRCGRRAESAEAEGDLEVMEWEGSAERRRDWLGGEERSNGSAFNDHQPCRGSCLLHRTHRVRRRTRVF